MQWPEHGKAGQIGPAQWKSIDGMYEGVGDRGEAPDGLRASGTHWYTPSQCCSISLVSNTFTIHTQVAIMTAIFPGVCRRSIAEALSVHPVHEFIASMGGVDIHRGWLRSQ